jgi:hypothetical protein
MSKYSPNKTKVDPKPGLKQESHKIYSSLAGFSTQSKRGSDFLLSCPIKFFKVLNSLEVTPNPEKSLGISQG